MSERRHRLVVEMGMTLLHLGFMNSKADSSLFVYNKDGVLTSFLVYVDDLIITGNNNKFLATGQQFSLNLLAPLTTPVGQLHFFLGVEVVSTKSGLFLSQHKYIRDLLTRTQMDGAKDVSTPLPTTGSLRLNDVFG